MLSLLFAQIGISLPGLVQAVVYLMIVGAVIWLLLWLIAYCGVPEPFNKIARVICVIVGVLLVINLLLSFAGHPAFILR